MRGQDEEGEEEEGGAEEGAEEGGGGAAAEEELYPKTFKDILGKNIGKELGKNFIYLSD